MINIHYRSKKCLSDTIYDLIVYCIAWGSLIIVAYPLIYVVSCSFSDPMSILKGDVWLLPVNPTVKAYKAIIQDQQIIRSFLNSVLIVIIGTIITLIINILAAYPLYRRNFVGKGLIMFLFSFTMFFNGGMIPNYMVVCNLGMLDSIWSLVIPGALGVWSVIVIRTFFQQNIPEELREATMLDGGSDFSFLLRVVIPLSKAIIAVIALMYAVGRWNGYFDAMIFLSDSKKYPLQLVLRQILILNKLDVTMMGEMNVRDMALKQSTADLLKYAVIVVSSLPVMLMYPFAQKYFVKGVVIGSLKG